MLRPRVSIDLTTANQQSSQELQTIIQLSQNIQRNQLTHIHHISHGASGTVDKVRHNPSNTIIALKTIPVAADEKIQKAILQELRALHESAHSSIVHFYGAFYAEGAVHIALECMDASVLELMRAEETKMLAQPLVAAITRAVLNGLVYLHRERHIIHRDVKPSNLLVDAHGNIKIADFGVSGELSNTISKKKSWVGTMHYMSPERIAAAPYSYNSDVWSLGITVLELITGRFPYHAANESTPRRLAFWDLLHCIVEDPPPSPPEWGSPALRDFVCLCLRKQVEERASSSSLVEHVFCSPEFTMQPSQVSEWIRGSLSRVPSRENEDVESFATEPF